MAAFHGNQQPFNSRGKALAEEDSLRDSIRCCPTLIRRRRLSVRGSSRTATSNERHTLSDRRSMLGSPVCFEMEAGHRHAANMRLVNLDA